MSGQRHRPDEPARLPDRDDDQPGLEAFADWFVFRGSKTAQYAQVGNAVPPLLQYHIAAHLRREVFDDA